jgi:hypothetical protein
MSLKLAPFGIVTGGAKSSESPYLQHEQDVVLVLAGIHAAAQFIAGGPEGGVEVRFFMAMDHFDSERQVALCPLPLSESKAHDLG